MKTLLLTLVIPVNQQLTFFLVSAKWQGAIYIRPKKRSTEKNTMQSHLTLLQICKPSMPHDMVLLEIEQFDCTMKEKEEMVKNIFGYDPLPKAYFYDPQPTTKCLYPFCVAESCYLLPFAPPATVTYKTMMCTLGTLPARQREALRKALDVIDKSQPYPTQLSVKMRSLLPKMFVPLSVKLRSLLPKMYVGDIQLHYDEPVVCHSDEMDSVTNMVDYFNALFECFGKERLMWWRTLFDVNIMAEKHLELLRAGATIQGEVYMCKPIVHAEYGHMMIYNGKVAHYSFDSFRPGMALVCMFCEGEKPWSVKRIQANFAKKDREELKKPLLDATRTFVYQMQTEFIPFCQVSYDSVFRSMEALNGSIQNGTLELNKECIHEDASESLISVGAYQITEVDLLKQIVFLHKIL
jgi:hypothetical protein